MKTRKIVVAAVLGAVGASSFAQVDMRELANAARYAGQTAQQPQNAEAEQQQNRRTWERQQRRGQQQVQPQYEHRHDHRYDQRHDQRRYYEGRRYDYQPYAYQDRGRYYGPQYSYNYVPRYAVGGYAPAPYWHNHRYYVNDWRARQLYAPPYGYQWVETDTGELLLVALATGLIANIILSSR